MTASQVYTQFVNNLLDLREQQVLTQDQWDRIGREIMPVFHEILVDAIADEQAYYERGEVM